MNVKRQYSTIFDLQSQAFEQKTEYALKMLYVQVSNFHILMHVQDGKFA